MLFVRKVGTNISRKKISRQIPVSQRVFFKQSYQSFSTLHTTTQTHLPLPCLNSPFQRTSPLPKPVFPTSPLLLYNNFTISKSFCSTNAEETNPPEIEVQIEQNGVKEWTPSQVQDWLKGTKILEGQMITDHFANVNGDAFLNLSFEDLRKEPYSMGEEQAESLILKRLDLKNENEWSPNDVYLWAKNILITKIPSKKRKMIKLAKILDEQTVTGKVLLTLTKDELVEGYKMTRGSATILAEHIEEIKKRIAVEPPLIPSLKKLVNDHDIENFYKYEEKKTLTLERDKYPNLGEYFDAQWEKISNFSKLAELKSKQAVEYTEDEIKSLLGDYYKKNNPTLPVIKRKLDKGKFEPKFLKHRLPYMKTYEFITDSKSELQSNWDTGHRIMIASTGSGKSGVFLRYLCNNYGIYFSCITSGDFLNISIPREMIDQTCGKLAVFLRRYNDSICAYIRRACLLLIIVRVQSLLDKIRKSKESNPTQLPPPDEFLRWQMNGENLIDSYYLENLLNSDLLNIYDYNEVVHLAKQRFRQLSEIGPGSLSFIVDEAQEFVDSSVSSNQIYSRNGNPRRAILSVLLWMFLEINETIPIATLGTAYTQEHAEIHMSYVDKPSYQSIMPEVNLIKSAEDVIRYLKLHITIPVVSEIWLNSKEFIDEYLPLRIRTLASVIGVLIEEAKNLENLSPLEKLKKCFNIAVDTMVLGLEKKIGVKFFTVNRFSEPFLTTYKQRFFNKIYDYNAAHDTNFMELVQVSGIFHYSILNDGNAINSFKSIEETSYSEPKIAVRLKVDARGPYLPRMLEKKVNTFGIAHECAKYHLEHNVKPTSATDFEDVVAMSIIGYSGKNLNDLIWLHPRFRGDHKLIANVILESNRLRKYLSKYLLDIPSDDELRNNELFTIPVIEGTENKKSTVEVSEEDLVFFWAMMKPERAVFLEGIIVKLTNYCHIDLAFVQFQDDPSDYRYKIESEKFYDQKNLPKPNDNNNKEKEKIIKVPRYYLSCWAIKFISSNAKKQYDFQMKKNVAQSLPQLAYQENSTNVLGKEIISKMPPFLQSVPCLSVAFEMHVHDMKENHSKFEYIPNLTMISCGPNSTTCSHDGVQAPNIDKYLFFPSDLTNFINKTQQETMSDQSDQYD